MRHFHFRLTGLIAICLLLSACNDQAEPTAVAQQTDTPAAQSTAAAINKPLVLVSDHASGRVHVIRHNGDTGNVLIDSLSVGAGPGDMSATQHNQVFVNVADSNLVAVLDPADGSMKLTQNLAAGTRPVHSLLDPDGLRVWALNDGDRSNGVDSINCAAENTASVTVLQNHGDGAAHHELAHEPEHVHHHAVRNDDAEKGEHASVLTTICIGRGHHKAAFSHPSDEAPAAPHRTFISNIKDGTVSVIDNEPASAGYLTVVATVDLCDANKETCDTDVTTPNGATPHGLSYSTHTGKIYSANVGYGTVAVIDPASATIESVIDLGFANKVQISPDGRYLVTKGADTQSNLNHVVGKLGVVDLMNGTSVTLDLLDVSPDSLVFTPDGSKLYVASALNGSAAQQANLKSNVVLAYDLSTPLSPTLVREITVGHANGGHRALALHAHGLSAKHLFVPNGADGTVSVIKIADDSVPETLTVGGTPGALMVYMPPAEDSDDPAGSGHDDHQH